MKNKNKIILSFLIFFPMVLGQYFLNVSLVKADTDIMSDPDVNKRTIIPIPFGMGSGADAPTLNFSVDSGQIFSGALSVALSWTSTNATSCVASTDPVNSQWDGSRSLSGSQTISGITTNTAVYLNCSGPGGSITKGMLFSPISISSPPPTLTLYVDSANLSSDGSAVLTWVSVNATSCTASSSPANSQWNGSIGLFGSQIINNITNNIAVSITCSGPGGWATKGIAYSPDYTSAHRPTLTLSASPINISSGDSVALTWASTNATSCAASSSPTNDQWNGPKNTSGSQTISNISIDTAFALTCPGAGGDANDIASIVLNKNILENEPSYPPTLTLYASPVNISASGSTLLNWASANAASCIASSSPANSQWNGIKDVSGLQTINNITASTTFSLVCSGAGGNINDAALVALGNSSSSVSSQIQTPQLQNQINQILSQIAQLQSQLATAQQQLTTQQSGSNSDFCYTFTKILRYRDTGYAVGALQAILKKEGLLNITKLTTYFGEATLQSVIAFQEKYRDEILAQYGLANGTGIVGTATIKKLNQLYRCN